MERAPEDGSEEGGGGGSGGEDEEEDGSESDDDDIGEEAPRQTAVRSHKARVGGNILL